MWFDSISVNHDGKYVISDGPVIRDDNSIPCLRWCLFNLGVHQDSPL